MKAVAVALALIACKTADKPRETPQPAKLVIDDDTEQLVTAITDDWTATRATLRLWTRTNGGAWQPAGEPWPAVVGRSGTAWGIGLHGGGAPGRPGPSKIEGDGKSPAGLFGLRSAYGYAAQPPPGTRWPYVAVDDRTECVDDPASKHYASIVKRDAAADWKSSEQMKRADELYAWVLDIAHNGEAVPGKGSCIFFHIWSGPESTTSGCTAMERPRLESLMTALDPAKLPLYILLPRSEYDALATPWGLPVQ